MDLDQRFGGQQDVGKKPRSVDRRVAGQRERLEVTQRHLAFVGDGTRHPIPMNVLQNRLQHKAPEVCACIQGVQEVVEGEVTATVAQSEFPKASIYCEVFGSHGERNSERPEAGKSLWSKL